MTFLRRTLPASQRPGISLTASKQPPNVRRAPKRVANLVQSELMGRLNALGLELDQSPVTMDGIVLAADLAEKGELSSKQLKQLFDSRL